MKHDAMALAAELAARQAWNEYATARRCLTARERLNVRLPDDRGYTEADCQLLAQALRDVWGLHLVNEPRNTDPDVLGQRRGAWPASSPMCMTRQRCSTRLTSRCTRGWMHSKISFEPNTSDGAQTLSSRRSRVRAYRSSVLLSDSAPNKPNLRVYS